MAASDLKVVYIIGWGRSGSTLLDNILGQFPGIVNVGELHYLWERGLIERRLCGCGEPVPECPFWSRVIAAMDPPTDIDAWARHMVAVQRSTIRERHTLKILRDRVSTGDTTGLSELLSAMDRLYRAIAEVSGSSVIVDSSKRPPNAAALVHLDSVTPYFVHLVRDPRAVAYSWVRPKKQVDTDRLNFMRGFSPTVSSVRWTVSNIAAEMLRRKDRARFLSIRYEDLVDHPRTTVHSILDLIGIDSHDSPFVDETSVSIARTHTVSGNPSRFASGVVKIRRDDEWRTAQSKRDRLISSIWAAPLLRKYGYRFVPD